jgi:signal-transduction protein with cAMP-binding, CBS, and nucleotidyltransferase domain
MQVIDATRRSGVGVSPDRTIEQVAQLMDQANVGAVVVIDGDAPVGIVTDRDLVRRAVARGLAPDARIDGVMSSPVVTIDAHADLHDAFALFGDHAIRRLGIVADGSFAGIIAVDDLLIDLASDLAAIARPVTAEVIFGHHDSPVPAVL